MPENKIEKRSWTSKEQRLLFVFFIVLVGSSAAVQSAVIALGAKYMWVSTLSWMPALSAVLALWVTKSDQGILGFRGSQRRWYLLGWATPIIYMAAIAALIIFGGLGWFDIGAYANKVGRNLGISNWSYEQILVLSLPWIVTIGVIKSLVTTLGEEIGMRGLLVPLFYKRFGFVNTSFLSGLIWVLWYSPIILWGGYHAKLQGFDQTALPLMVFAITTVSLSFPLAYLRLRSGSLWPSAIFHAVHNAILLSIMGWYLSAKKQTIIMIDGFGSVSPTGEFGYGLAGISILVAVCYCWLAYRDGMIGRKKETEFDGT